MKQRLHPLLCVALAGVAACAAPQISAQPPLAGLVNVDDLIQPGEEHFAHLWRVASGGENAEGYWNFANDQLSLQRTDSAHGCDRIFVTDREQGGLRQVSSGQGVTTCAFFMPDGRSVVFGSTQGHMQSCPPPVDRSEGYVWPIHPEYDLWVHNLDTGVEHQITDVWGYDAEATLSPLGDRMVFTSDRTGDLELWTCDLEGQALFQVTDELGYDGGAFFSNDGTKLVFRATRFVEESETQNGVGTRAQYKELLAKHKIRPHRLDLFVIDTDGTNRRQVTDLGGASWAPYFFPDDQRIIFSTNHHDTNTPQVEFDLFAVGIDGKNLERITTYRGFDSFPMFSDDGQWLVFASNRGGSVPGETNLYLAKWK